MSDETGGHASPSQLLSSADESIARIALTRCCGASRWVEGMLERRPFSDDDALYAAAEEVWAGMTRADILEAFDHHPRIGADIDKLRQKFAATQDLSVSEQSGVASASEATLQALRAGNIAYEERFGHIFIVCATGKTAAEMLALLNARLPNEPDDELRIAAGEQAKITRLRLEKLA